MSAAPVLVERLGGVGLIRFNRPEALNALDLAAKTALLAALQDLSSDPGVRCVVLTGTGRAFCVGQDLREHVTGLDQGGPESVLATVPEHYNPIAVLVHTMPKPVIAAVNGVAAGAGASARLPGGPPAGRDQRRVQPGVRPDRPVLRHRVLLDAAASGRSDDRPAAALPRRHDLGRGVTAAGDRHRGDTGRRVRGAGARRRSPARRGSHPGVRGDAPVGGAGAHSSLAEALAYEAEMMARTGATEDHRQAVDAFLAKRPPVFTGQRD